MAKEENHALGYRDLKGGLFEQLSRYTEVYRGFRLSDLTGYNAIHDLQKVRNCIVHAYGEPVMMSEKDKKYLLKLNMGTHGIEAIEGAPLGIEPLFIESSLAAARALFFALFAKVHWKINDRWLPKPPNTGSQP